MYKKILCGVDGSQYSDKAARHALELAKVFQAELTFMYVIPLPLLNLLAPGSSIVAPEFIPEQAEDYLKQRGEEILTEIKEKFKGELSSIYTVMETGHPDDELATAAQEEGYDLLVIGSRGMSGLEGLLMGSVSSHLIHSSPCPVLIVK